MPNIFAAKHTGKDIQPPVEIKVEILFFFKTKKDLRVRNNIFKNEKGRRK